MKFMQKVRRAIDALWPVVFVKGRGWGIKRSDNPYVGDTFFLNDGDETVIISQVGDVPNQAVTVRQFKQVNTTALGTLVIAALKVNKMEAIFPSPSVVPKIRIEITTRKVRGGYEVVVSVVRLSDSGDIDGDNIFLPSRGGATRFETEQVAKSAAVAINLALTNAFDLLGLEFKEDQESLAIEISI